MPEPRKSHGGDVDNEKPAENLTDVHEPSNVRPPSKPTPNSAPERKAGAGIETDDIE